MALFTELVPGIAKIKVWANIETDICVKVLSYLAGCTLCICRTIASQAASVTGFTLSIAGVSIESGIARGNAG